MSAKDPKDTITAISTPMGKGGIGIIRLSGNKAFSIADAIFVPGKKNKPSECPTHTVHHGYIIDPNGDIIDEVLLTVMKAPSTYTTEDMVEINCHGGAMPLKGVLELCLKKGARLAEPGEFTKRAFMKGRIDLAQAEAVLDIINSESEASRKMAVQHFRGIISREIDLMREKIVEVLSQIELTLDFSEEDVHFASVEKISKEVKTLRDTVKIVLDTAGKGMVLREGAEVVICGKPNVGKSSLMNALLRDDRVIVTPISGTTRDIVEELINISGVSVKIADTAGIVETNDVVEKEGVRRSREKISRSDLVIFMLDGTRSLSQEDMDIYELVKDKKKIVVVNKVDLAQQIEIDSIMEKFGVNGIISASVAKEIGISEIEDAIVEKVMEGGVSLPEGPVITNLRHKEALEEALRSVENAMNVTGKNYNGELLASDLNNAVRALGLITGETVSEDVLDRIFSQFCIGK